MHKKYFILFTSFLVFVSGRLIELINNEPYHIPNSFLTDIYAFILFILGVIYFVLCQIKMDKKQETLIDSCIFYTLAFPLLMVESRYLNVMFDIQLFDWIPDLLYRLGMNIFVAIQLVASTRLLVFFKKEKSII